MEADRNEIDRLMNLLPDELAAEPPQSIDNLIAYYRRQREGGARPQREAGPAPKIDLTKMGVLKPKVEETFKRRF